MERLHMVISYVTAQTPFVRQLFVLSQAVEYGTRELRVKTHEVSTDAKNIIGTLITIAGSDVDLRGTAAIEHQVNGSSGIDVYQAYLMTDTVVRQVDNTHLPALGTLAGYVEQTNLCTVQRVGIVDGT